MANPRAKSVIVLVDDQHVSGIQAVASDLRSAGLKVTSVLASTGIITGEISQENLASLSAIQGVKSIESDDEMEAI